MSDRLYKWMLDFEWATGVPLAAAISVLAIVLSLAAVAISLAWA